MDKKEIRNKKRKERETMSIKDAAYKSRIINKKLSAIINSYNVIMFYISTKNEVRTHDLIKYYLKKNKKVIVPYIKDNKIFSSEITNFNDLERGVFKILEPKIKKEFKGKIDLITVPGIGFDKYGNRIGRGLGYYDIFLKDINAEIIALAYDFQIVANIPSEEYDIKVNKIITEKRIINCI